MYRSRCDERDADWHAINEAVTELAAEQVGRVGGEEYPRLSSPVEEWDHTWLAGAAAEVIGAAADVRDLAQTLGGEPSQALWLFDADSMRADSGAVAQGWVMVISASPLSAT